MEQNVPPVVAEFTHQAPTFAAAPVMRSAVTLEGLLALLPAAAGQRWCDLACGPGIVTRALARRVREAVGVDVTPAMVQIARRDAERENIANVRFVVADASRIPFAGASFDGALTRFSLHHIPVPARVLDEMARVVGPGGTVAVADALTSPDGTAAAWHQEIERLRDPSHWANLSWPALSSLGSRCGLTLVGRHLAAFDLDFEEWLIRGSGGSGNRALIERLLASPPPGAEQVFAVRHGRLYLQLGMAVWTRPQRP